MQANTIDEVIAQLGDIIQDSKEAQSPMGYFAALYQKVTVRVKKGIAEGEFENGLRMEKLDIVFANRYLEAYEAYLAGNQTTESWRIAFNKTERYWPIVLQHLLWGMNAHINLDLGIAAAEISPGESIENLKNDFDKINSILAELVDDVERELSRVWPPLKAILGISGKLDDLIVNFSMQAARDGAWRFARKLAPLSANERQQAIISRDKEIALIANLVDPPGILSRIAVRMIRIGERGTVAKRIDILKA